MPLLAEAELADALLSYCRERGLVGPARLAELRRISDGWETDVYVFALESAAAEAGAAGAAGSDAPARQELILRAYPGAGAAAKAAREFAVLRRLGAAGYPVPAVLALAAADSPLGLPFLIMRRVAGEPLSQAIHRSPLGRKLELVRLFARLLVDLHALDWRPLAPDGARPDDWRLDRWLDLTWAYVAPFGVAGLAPAFAWLRERAGEVGEPWLALVHHDYHARNVLFCEGGERQGSEGGDGGAAFVIDWTQAEVADRRLDLGWTLLLMGLYDGWAMREAILGEYEALAGRRVEHVEYFEALAAAKRLGSILISVRGGADRLGMRPGAEAKMLGNLGHVEAVYTLLRYRTGLALPEVERTLAELAG